CLANCLSYHDSQMAILCIFFLRVILLRQLIFTLFPYTTLFRSRKIPVQIPRKVMGRGRIREGQKSFIPLRIKSAGVMPIIFAQSIIIVPGTLAAFSSFALLRSLSEVIQPNNWLYYLTYTVLIVFFTYFYTAIIFNPVDLAENLKKQGACIPGVKPGARTAEYIDWVLSRITLPGSIYLALIALLPFWIFDIFNIQTFIFGGTS